MKLYVARNFNSRVMGIFDSLEGLIDAMIDDRDTWRFYTIRVQELNTYHKSGWGHLGSVLSQETLDVVAAKQKELRK
jgi:hypothetical protein